MREADFRLIVGLGNPGEKFTKTRHNIGCMALERLAEKHSAGFRFNKKLSAQIADIGNGNEKPTTYLFKAKIQPRPQ